MMDASQIVESLNSAQHEVVTAPPKSLCVLAGAGSGKTRCLVHRIAWLIEVHGYSPFSLLAVTFTNKAASEMRGRIEQLLGMSVSGMWVGTFHSIAHRILRMHWADAGLAEQFQILDSDDQFRLVKRVLKSLNIDEQRWPPKQAQWFINSKKDEGLRPDQIDAGRDPFTRTYLQVYEAYEEACKYGGLVDFSELLLRSYELLSKNPEILSHYQQRFRMILVDEFQDTNQLQYAWLRLFAGEHNHMMVVGDDDQSIYGWRGARVENLHRFTEDYPDSQLIRLEQNYRSTGTILMAANALIQNNQERFGKELWTDQGDGVPISVYAAMNEIDEAQFIVQQIQRNLEEGDARSDHAILYRSNAQSRVLEEMLLRAGIPYRVYGGQRFFERAEIKDAMGYLRLIANRDDDAGFERVINVPARGIGEKTLESLRDRARQESISLWGSARKTIAENGLAQRAERALSNFLNLMEELAEQIKYKTLAEQIEEVIHASGLHEYYNKDRSEKSRARLENLSELVTAARQFQTEDENQSALTEFLSHAMLESGEAQADVEADCVQLMTLHSAKGLEFKTVFIAGLEERLFPHEMCLEDPLQLEEERRLCYVGFTRAREKLYCMYAERRQLHGREKYHRPSRFLREIPEHCKQSVRLHGKVTRPHTSFQSKPTSVYAVPDAIPDTSLRIGQRVKHPQFGEGVILNYEGRGDHARVQVQFERQGSKWLVASYAKLETA